MLTESRWIESQESTEKRPAKLCLLRSFLTKRFCPCIKDRWVTIHKKTA